MFLEILTPDAKVFEGEVEVTTLPGFDGYFQILDNHAPLVSPLGKGYLTYKKKKDEQSLLVDGGIVEVYNNRITVLAESLIKE